MRLDAIQTTVIDDELVVMGLDTLGRVWIKRGTRAWVEYGNPVEKLVEPTPRNPAK